MRVKKKRDKVMQNYSTSSSIDKSRYLTESHCYWALFSLVPHARLQGHLWQDISGLSSPSNIHKFLLPLPLLRLEVPQSRNHLGMFVQHQAQQHPAFSR